MTHASIALALALTAPLAAQPSPGTARTPYVERIPGSLVTFEMMPVPGGTVQLETPAGPRAVPLDPFWIGKTEVTWDLYDVYAFGLDRAAETSGADAVARPSRPYVLPGDQFGHQGHPALGMTFHAARGFARWLSGKTGRRYRLPTEAEWEHACRMGHSEPERSADLPSRAWYAANSAERTHPVAGREPNRLGIHDVLGNVAEWVAAAGDSVVKGGAYSDAAGRLGCGARWRQSDAWNATDPQLPKSIWWLPDAPFVGFRLVREP